MSAARVRAAVERLRHIPNWISILTDRHLIAAPDGKDTTKVRRGIKSGYAVMNRAIQAF